MARQPGSDPAVRCLDLGGWPLPAPFGGSTCTVFALLSCLPSPFASYPCQARLRLLRRPGCCCCLFRVCSKIPAIHTNPPSCRRDEALAAIQASITKQQEQEQAIEAEIRGCARDAAREQVGVASKGLSAVKSCQA